MEQEQINLWCHATHPRIFDNHDVIAGVRLSHMAEVVVEVVGETAFNSKSYGP